MAVNNSLVFYPGSGNDIVPILIKDLTQNRADTAHEFIYCDPADQIESFFKSLINRKDESLSANQLADLNPQYRAFISNLNLDSLKVKGAEKEESKDTPLTFEFDISYKTGESVSKTLHFFSVKAETYLNELHSNYFPGREVNTILHITQISSTQRRSKHLFNPKNFLDLLKNHPELKSVKFVVTDNPELYADTRYSQESGDIFIGWGYSGNSLVSKQSARVLVAEEKSDKSGANQSQQDEKLDSIRKKLGEMKFEW